MSDEPKQRATRAELETICREIASQINDEMNDPSSGPPLGFCLWIFDFGEGGNISYISNARRSDVIRMMREHLAHLERNTN